MQFDSDNLMNTARAVLRFNKYAAGDTLEHICECMRSAAYREYHSRDGRGSYVSTYGYVLVPFRNPAGEVEILTCPAAHLFNV